MRGGMFNHQPKFPPDFSSYVGTTVMPSNGSIRGVGSDFASMGGSVFSTNPAAQPLPNVVGGYPALQHIKVIEDRGIIQIGSQEFREAMHYAKQQAYLKSECLSIIPVYRTCHQLMVGLTGILDHPRVKEFLDAYGDEILFTDTESVNSYKARIYERGRELPEPDRYNDCQLISAPPGLS